ncbi:MAG: hypothetical protein OSA38_07200 [Candidatus Poseidoniaceae archaeon]|nr:hypothetical protein [Candidatus Poseidoniaceae archaeon]
MEDLVQTLVTGFLVSGLFIVIVWWFWHRYDQPSETQLAREEELGKKIEEQQMWRAVEAQMADEKEKMDEQALYLRKKADQHERVQPPAAGALSNALEAFDAVTTPVLEGALQAQTFDDTHAAPTEGTGLDESDLVTEDDLDLLLAASPIQVRQDIGVAAPSESNAPEPDWALVEKLEQLANAEAIEEVPHPDLPEAPDLEVLTIAQPLMNADPDDVVQWDPSDDSLAEDAWDVQWTTVPDEEE